MNTLKDCIAIHCRYCQKGTDHTRAGIFLFLPETLTLAFKRFEHHNGTENKKHSTIQLPLEIQLEGNMIYRYNIRACTLHHGMHIHNGHYTTIIFDNGGVKEIDDEIVNDVTDDWVRPLQSTVHMAFYKKKYTYTHPEPTKDISCLHSIESETRSASEEVDGACRHLSKEKTNASEMKIIHSLYDASKKYELICSFKTSGYDLNGPNFKTLELPVLNTSYCLDNPGWLNDNIVDAYITLLVKAASEKGTRVHALNCFFYTAFRKAVLEERSEEKVCNMISKFYKNIEFEALDYISMPINNKNGEHWTAVYVDIWKKGIYYCDPMAKGS